MRIAGYRELIRLKSVRDDWYAVRKMFVKKNKSKSRTQGKKKVVL